LLLPLILYIFAFTLSRRSFTQGRCAFPLGSVLSLLLAVSNTLRRTILVCAVNLSKVLVFQESAFTSGIFTLGIGE
jgi:hypothetical protein